MRETKPKSFLFFTPYGHWQLHNQIDAMVAAAMLARNCRIRIVTCDGLYQPCAIDKGKRKQDCNGCQYRIAETLSMFGLPSSPLSTFITEEDISYVDAWVADLPDGALA